MLQIVEKKVDAITADPNITGMKEKISKGLLWLELFKPFAKILGTKAYNGFLDVIAVLKAAKKLKSFN